MQDLHELKGKILGCCCKRKGYEPCHGDVLVRMLNEQIREQIKSENERVAKIEREKIMKEESNKVMAKFSILVEENRQILKTMKENNERERRETERINREQNEKKRVRYQDIIEKYGDDHEMSSLCKYIDRPLTPIRNIPSPPLSPMEFEIPGDNRTISPSA